MPLAAGIFRHPQPFTFMPRPIYPPQRFNVRQRLPVYNTRSIRILPANTETATSSMSSVSASISEVLSTCDKDDTAAENKTEATPAKKAEETQTQSTSNSKNDQ